MTRVFRNSNGDQIVIGATKAASRFRASPVTSLDQTAEFGALTAAGGGAWKPVDADGDTFDLTGYDSLVSGSLGSYTPAVSSGALTFTGATGAPDGAVLRLNHAGGTLDVTISTLADTYSCATGGQVRTAISAIGSAGGKTIRLRRGTIAESWATTRWGEWGNYTNTITIEGEGVATSGKGTKLTPCIWAKDVKNIRYKNIESTGGEGFAPGEISGSSEHIYIEDCWLHRTPLDPFDTYIDTWTYGNGIKAGTVNKLYVRRNLIEWCYSGIAFTAGADGFAIEDNEFRYFIDDPIKIGMGSNNSGVKSIQRNVAFGSIYGKTLAEAEPPHADFIQFTAIGATGTDNCTNLIIRQNVCFAGAGISSREFGGGIVSFLDTSTTGRQFTDIICCGNIIINRNQNAIVFRNVSGGIFAHNLCANTETSGGGNRLTMELGGGASTGTVKVTRNVVDDLSLQGSATYTQTDNVELGLNGGAVAYTTAFAGTDFATEPLTYAAVLAKYAPKSGGPLAGTPGIGPISTGYGTYGNPRDPDSWSYDPAYEV